MDQRTVESTSGQRYETAQQMPVKSAAAGTTTQAATSLLIHGKRGQRQVLNFPGRETYRLPTPPMPHRQAKHPLSIHKTPPLVVRRSMSPTALEIGRLTSAIVPLTSGEGLTITLLQFGTARRQVAPIRKRRSCRRHVEITRWRPSSFQTKPCCRQGWTGGFSPQPYTSSPGLIWICPLR